MTTDQPCIDCVREEVPHPAVRYKSTSYCRKHNTLRVRASQRNSGLKKIIAQQSWADLQKRRTDNTYWYSYVQLMPLIQHYRELAEKAAGAALLSASNRRAPEFLEPAQEAEQCGIIARSIQLRRELTPAERRALLEELELTPRDDQSAVELDASGAHVDVEDEVVDDDGIYASAEDTSWQQNLNEPNRWSSGAN